MRTTLLGLPVDLLTEAETVAIAMRAMQCGTRCQHVALNVAKLVSARGDTELDRDIRRSDIVGIDGMGIAWALRLLGARGVRRVAGVDLFESLIDLCAAEGRRPFLHGATPEIARAAARELKRRHPDLDLAGVHHGYFRTDAEEAAVCAAIAASGAHCLFVAMPTPRKERFMLRNGERLGVPFVMGIGGTLDVVAGEVRRAPRIVQQAGLEWLYRLSQEPRRLAARYSRTNAIFALLMAREIGTRITARLFTARSSGQAG